MKSKDQQRLEEAYTSIFDRTVRRILNESNNDESILNIVKSCVIMDQSSLERYKFEKDEGKTFTLKRKDGQIERFWKNSDADPDTLQLDGLTLMAQEHDSDEEATFDLLPKKVKDYKGTVYTIKRIAPDFAFVTYNDPEGTPHNFHLGDDFQFDGTTISVVDYDSDAEDRLTIVHD
jgi:hypothetical protein